MTFEEFKAVYIPLWNDAGANYDLILELVEAYPEYEKRLIVEQDEQENQ
jgi:hypothetical protein